MKGIGLVSLRRRNRGKRSCVHLSSNSSRSLKKPKNLKPRTKEQKEIDVLLSKDVKNLTLQETYKLASHLRHTSQFTMRVKNVTIGGVLKVRRRNDENRRMSEDRDSNSTIESTYSQKWDVSLNIEDVKGETRKKIGKGFQRRLTEDSEIGCLPKADSLRKSVKKVVWNEVEKQIYYEQQLRNTIENDPELCGYYQRRFKCRIDKTVMKTNAKTLWRHFNEKDGKQVANGDQEIQFTEKLMKFIRNGAYNPPRNRLQFIVEKSKNWDTSALIFSDIPKEEPDNIKIPHTLLYKYTNRNVVNEKKCPELAAIKKEAEKKIIKCDCCTGGAIKRCWQNPNCPCYITNMKLRQFQQVDDVVVNEKTNFSTFNPVLLRGGNSFFDTIGFACSDECECAGKCTNNVTLLIEKDVHPLELYRKDEQMGFGLRANTFIPCGTPVVEFTGELNHGDVKKSEHDYSYAIFSEDDSFPTMISKVLGKNTKFVAEIKKQFEKDERWFVNPKHIGNIARTCCHSCEPNMSMVRVFQKGFSPAHCRLLLVTHEVIFPGNELTFDYGPGYIQETLGNKCLCNKAGCRCSNIYETFSKCSEKSLEKYQALRYHIGYAEFKRNVLDAIEKKQSQKVVAQ
ncbi:hypothetical protein CRE_10256 [Caenorhabditis remanei]|uniref:Uncharacterized protein n=1 Tax=Caenorhabditis remanei TaxID=31234 RepID=E3M655_CAERE|nr:hypothetical protein CRE_10256 [Caenorhabditis remanei]